MLKSALGRIRQFARLRNRGGETARRKAHLHRAVLEALEERQLFSTYQLSGAGSVHLNNTYGLTISSDSESNFVAVVDWGDGSVESVNCAAGTDNVAGHTYGATGVYNISGYALDDWGQQPFPPLVVNGTNYVSNPAQAVESGAASYRAVTSEGGDYYLLAVYGDNYYVMKYDHFGLVNAYNSNAGYVSGANGSAVTMCALADGGVAIAKAQSYSSSVTVSRYSPQGSLTSLTTVSASRSDLNSFFGMCASPTGRLVLGVTNGSSAQILDVSTNTVVASLDGSFNSELSSNGLAFGPDGDIVAAYTGTDGSWHLSRYSASGLDSDATFALSGVPQQIAIAPDGEIALAGAGAVVRIDPYGAGPRITFGDQGVKSVSGLYDAIGLSISASHELQALDPYGLFLVSADGSVVSQTDTAGLGGFPYPPGTVNFTAYAPHAFGQSLVVRSDMAVYTLGYLSVFNVIPDTPASVQVVSHTATSVLIKWPKAASATAYEVHRTSGGEEVVTKTSALAFYDGSVLPNKTYTYTVRAIGPWGDYSPSSVPASTTIPANQLAAVLQDHSPPQIGTFAVSTATGAKGDSWIKLTWTVNDDVSIQRYRLLRDNVPVADLPATGSTNHTLNYTDYRLARGHSYTYTLVAYDAAGQTASSTTTATTLGTDTTAPAAPQNLKAVTATVKSSTDASKVVLTWTPSGDNVGVTSYAVTRTSLNGAAASVSLSVTYNSVKKRWEATDTLTANDIWEYCTYTVKAYDAAGNVSPSATLNVSPTNNPYASAGFATDQYIPEDYLKLFYDADASSEGLVARLRHLASIVGGGWSVAAHWLDLGANRDTIIINKTLRTNFSAVPNSFYHDTNGNSRYDAGEPAWLGGSPYTTAYHTVGGAPQVGMYGTPGLYYQSMNGNGTDFVPGTDDARVLAFDLSRVKSSDLNQNEYLFRDSNSNGKWDTGEPIWQEGPVKDGVYGSGDAIIYPGTITLTTGSRGRAAGLNYFQPEPGQGERIVWVDNTTFSEDFPAFYDALESLIPRFTSASDRVNALKVPAFLQSIGLPVVTLPGLASSDGWTITLPGGDLQNDVNPGDWVQLNSQWYEVASAYGATMTLKASVPTLTNQTLHVMDWTRVPQATDLRTGAPLALRLGKPLAPSANGGAAAPVFKEQFAELRAALAALCDGSGTPYLPLTQYFDTASFTKFSSVVSVVTSTYEAVFGPSSWVSSLRNALSWGDAAPGTRIRNFISDLRGLILPGYQGPASIADVIYCRDPLNPRGWKVDPYYPWITVTFSSTVGRALLLPGGQWAGGGTGLAQLTEIEGAIGVIRDNGLWIAKTGFPTWDFSRMSMTRQYFEGTTESTGEPSTWNYTSNTPETWRDWGIRADINDPGLDSPTYHFATLNASVFGGYSTRYTTTATLTLPDASNPNGGVSLGAQVAFGPEHSVDPGTFCGNNVLDILEPTAGWTWGSSYLALNFTQEKSDDLLDDIYNTLLSNFVSSGSDLTYNGYWKGNRSLRVMGTVAGTSAAPYISFRVDLFLPILNLYGQIPTPAVGPGGTAAPLTLPALKSASGDFLVTNEMDARNTVPDSNLDGIINLPVNLDAFGPDTGAIVLTTESDRALTYIPTGLGVFGLGYTYWVQGAFAAPGGLLSTASTGPDTPEAGLPYANSADMRIVDTFFMNDKYNHVKRKTLTRPGGNAVTFDFPWDPAERAFSLIGYPLDNPLTGRLDSKRTYVLREVKRDYVTSGQTKADKLTYYLEFADGTVHQFEQAAGEKFASFKNAQTPDGRATSGGSNARYDVTPNWSGGRLQSVDYKGKPDSNGAKQTIRTVLGYTGDLVTSLAKHYAPAGAVQDTSPSIPEFSFTLVNAGTVTSGGTSVQRTGSRVGGGTVSLTRIQPGGSSKDVTVYNADELPVQSSHYNDGRSPAVTNIVYYSDRRSRYDNGAPKWAKVKKIVRPDNSWQEYLYDSATGWVTSILTPFKGSQAPDPANLASPTWQSVEYEYDAALSGGGDTANPYALVERPRQTTTRLAGTIVGLSYITYNGLEITTRQPYSVMTGGTVSDWTSPAYEIYTVLSANAWQPANVYTPSGATLYSVGSSANGAYTLNSTTLGPMTGGPAISNSASSTWQAMSTAVRNTLTTTATTFSATGAIVGSITKNLLTNPAAPNATFATSNVVTASFTATFDGFGRPLITTNGLSGETVENRYTDPDTGEASWWGPAVTIDARILTTKFKYDTVGRIQKTIRTGVTTKYDYDGDSHVVGTTTISTGGTITTSSSFDSLGRLAKTTNELKKDTTFDYQFDSTLGLTRVIATYNSGAAPANQSVTKTETYLDGRLKAVWGDTTTRTNYDYKPETNGYYVQTVTDTTSTDPTDSSQGNLTVQHYDLQGNLYLTETSSPAGTQSASTVYDVLNRPVLTTNTADQSYARTEYNAVTGRVSAVYTSVAGQRTSQVISTGYYNATDLKDVGTGAVVFRTQVQTNGETASSETTSQAVDGLRAWHKSVQVVKGSPTTVETYTSTDLTNVASTPGFWRVITKNSDDTQNVSIYEDGLLAAEDTLARKFLNGAWQDVRVARTHYGYDALRRNTAVEQWLRDEGLAVPVYLTTTFELRDNGQIKKILYPINPNNPSEPREYEEVVTFNERTEQPETVRQRDGNVVTTLHNARGEVVSVTGGGVVPYMTQNTPESGSLTLSTFKDGSVGNSAPGNIATTLWKTDPKTGLLQFKQYADGSRDSYHYNNSGQLDNATTSGGTVITYAYTPDGAQNQAVYKKNGQADIVYTAGVPDPEHPGQYTGGFDRSGNVVQRTEEAYGTSVTNYFVYDDQNRLTHESMGHVQAAGLGQMAVSYNYENTGRLAGFARGYTVLAQSDSDGTETSLLDASYDYNEKSQLYTVTEKIGPAGAPIGTNQASYEYYDGTDAIKKMTIGAVETTYAYDPTYTYLTQITTSSGGAQRYQAKYDYYKAGDVGGAVGQVKRMEVHSALPGGGTDDYYVDYTYTNGQIYTALAFNMDGTQHDPASPGSVFFFDAVGNRTNPPGGTGWNSNALNQYTAGPGGETFQYDGDGNLVRHNQFIYSYDALNRLTLVQENFVIKASYTYDAAGRRTSETQWEWMGIPGTGVSFNGKTKVTYYLYSGTNIVGEEVQDVTYTYDPRQSWEPIAHYGDRHLARTYAWNPAAQGGVGGLLWISTYNSDGSVAEVYIPTLNAHGDVTGLIRRSDGAVVANYTYSPFGMRTAAGPAKDVCPWGWQTEYQEDRVGLILFERRAYSPRMGRFLQRDPAGLASDLNEYRYSKNDPVGRVDPDGRADISASTIKTSSAALPIPPTERPQMRAATPEQVLRAEYQSLTDSHQFVEDHRFHWMWHPLAETRIEFSTQDLRDDKNNEARRRAIEASLSDLAQQRVLKDTEGDRIQFAYTMEGAAAAGVKGAAPPVTFQGPILSGAPTMVGTWVGPAPLPVPKLFTPVVFQAFRGGPNATAPLSPNWAGPAKVGKYWQPAAFGPFYHSTLANPAALPKIVESGELLGYPMGHFGGGGSATPAARARVITGDLPSGPDAQGVVFYTDIAPDFGLGDSEPRWYGRIWSESHKIPIVITGIHIPKPTVVPNPAALNPFAGQ